MRINHNITALNTYRQLSTNTDNQSKSIEKLSSGLRINRAGDDAAGLAISEKMRGQIRGLDQASRNAQDGISLIQTAEGALNETHSILQRMRELATQAANGTNTDQDRASIQSEMNQLSTETNRIGNTTEFNTQKLLNGGSVNTATAVNTTTKGADKGVVSGVSTLATGKAAVAAVFDSGALTVLTTGQSGTFTFNGTKVNITAGTSGTGSTTANISGNSIDLTLDVTTTTGDDTAAKQTVAIAAALNSMKAYSGSPLANFTISGAGSKITFTGTTTDGAKNNSQVITTTGNVTIANTTGAGQLTTKGVDEAKGQLSFSIDKQFNLNDTIAFGGTTFTGKSALTTGLGTNQFDIDGDPTAQAASLAKAMNADTGGVGARYNVTTAGNKLILTEKTGSAAAAMTMGTVTSTATAGVYNFNIDDTNLVKTGGKYSIDGVDIKVTSDATDAGIAKGNSILVGADKNEQAKNLAGAIQLNSQLSTKYSVTTAGSQVTLTQKTGQESRITPSVSTNTQAISGFSANFQIGANTGQSMTVNVSDMRSAALKTTSASASGNVTAANGKVASYAATATVSNGSDNNNVEYSLDLSTTDKATAAISVLDDAINSVSSQRSALGAYQNRLEHTINNLNTSNENLTAAESRIRDVDMAKEMMNQSKNSILAQAAQAMLAQANQQPQGVLQLLR